MSELLVPLRSALLSVFDKTDLIPLATALSKRGVTLYASSGTAKAIADAGLPVTEVAQHTGAPEILGGRVKTLHPRIHGGILANRSKEGDLKDLEAQDIPPIDCVVANLYPFMAIWAKAQEEARLAHESGGNPEAAAADKIVEMIDIGGPAMIRAAAKNHAHVTVLTSASQYHTLLDQLERHDGKVPLSFRLDCALSAFRMTAAYDAAIATWMQQAFEPALATFPDVFVRRFEKIADLRYGENPHQQAAYYRETGINETTFAASVQLHGQPPSYNNIVDTEAALQLVREFKDPACVVIKHTNPCGAAIGDTLLDAFDRAYNADPLSAYGGIVGLNRSLDLATAHAILGEGHYFECIIAPDYDDDALAAIQTAPKWAERFRVFRCGSIGPDLPWHHTSIRGIDGGLLVQSANATLFADPPHQCATDVKPSEQQQRDLEFAWVVCKHTKSNAIVFAKDGVAVGVGAGQMSRVDSVHVAARRAGDKAAGAVMASDAFFPFADGVLAAIDAGITAVIQPGGSIRDKDVIKVCNERKIPMLLTHIRHFKH